jgi:ketosteroid isomerase-like protein
LGAADRDRYAISALIQRYANCIDSGDLDAMAELFAYASVYAPRFGGGGPDAVRRGSEEVRRDFDGLVQDEHGLLGTHHVVFDSEIHVDGDQASATSFVTVIHDGKPILAGRYLDKFVRGPDGWRFHERRPHLDLIGDVSAHAPRLAARLADADRRVR